VISENSTSQYRKRGILSCLTALMLVAALLTATLSPLAQSPARVVTAKTAAPSPKVRPKRTLAQGLEARLPQTRAENPFVPVIVHGFERYLAGAPAETFVDHAVRDALRRHPRVTRRHLQTLVNNYESLPAATRARFEPPELRNLNGSQRLDVRLLEKAYARSLSAPASGIQGINNNFGKASAYLLATLPRIKTLFGTAHKKEADGTPIITKGGNFMIDADNVPADKAKVKIHFLDLVGASTQVVATVAPNTITMGSSGATTMTATAPADLSYGHFQIQVEVVGRAKSNKVWAANPTIKLKFDPHISSIDPPARYPGSKAELAGIFAFKDVHLIMERLDEEGFDNFTLTSNDLQDGVKWVNPAQIDFTVPQTIPPGDYRLAVRKSTGGKRSNWVKFTVKAPQYQVKFTKAFCNDESNPEGGSDDLTTMWIIDVDLDYKNEQMAFDEDYYEFDEKASNSELPYLSKHQQVYPTSEKITRPVKQHMVILATAMDWDTGDVDEAKEVLGAISSVAVSIGAAFGGVGVAVGAVIAGVLSIIGVVVGLWGDPDLIGSVAALSHTAPELQVLTAGQKETHRKIRVGWSDDSGEYDLYYTILRHQPN
jgi:hypothetical protein